MMFPVVRDLATDGVPVTVLCRVLELCRQHYYRWLAQPFTDAELDEAHVANAVFDAHRDDPEFGYRFLADEVRPQATRSVTGRCGGSRRRTAGGAGSGNPARTAKPQRQRTPRRRRRLCLPFRQG